MTSSQKPHEDARARLVAQIEILLADLLRSVGASRTTLRLDDPRWHFGVDDVVAEARAPGEKSLRGQTSINQRAAETAQWIERHRRLLVQDDLATGEPRPPDALIAMYNVKAQMLAPIVRKGRLDGWISVHETRATRRWSESDQAAAVAAAARVLATLEQAVADGSSTTD
jgi:maleate isomerase